MYDEGLGGILKDLCHQSKNLDLETYSQRITPEKSGGERVIIRFSHFYEKMPPDYQVSRLVGLDIVHIENLTKEFIEKDTAIIGGGHYKLPSQGKYMVLWLESSIMNIRWQTIRRWTKQKEEYYRSHIGKFCDIEITSEVGK